MLDEILDRARGAAGEATSTSRPTRTMSMSLRVDGSCPDRQPAVLDNIKR